VQPQPLDTASLADLVRAAPPRLGGVRLVVVDGPAGSGKSTVATGLAEALGDGTPVVSMDDLYDGWTGLGDDVWRRLRVQVLEPLAAGRPGRYRVYDWAAARFAGWRDVPVAPVLVVEGVGAAARAVDDVASVRVWVEAPAALRMRRGLDRDGEHLRDEWLAWTERETAHFASDGTAERADVLVDGGAPPVS
jgi:uridine kinase